MTLRDAALKSGFVSAGDFDRIVDPNKMVGHPRKDLNLA
jgi:fumarate hydratase class II